MSTLYRRGDSWWISSTEAPSTTTTSTTQAPVLARTSTSTASPTSSSSAATIAAVVALGLSGVFLLCVIVAVYYYFRFHCRSTAELRRRRQERSRDGAARGGENGSGESAQHPQPPATVHVIEGIPVDYAPIGSSRRRGTEDGAAALQRLPQATLATLPQDAAVPVTYHIRSRGRDRRLQVVTTPEADAPAFNPFALPPSLVHEHACVGLVVDSPRSFVGDAPGHGTAEQRDGSSKRRRRLDYGTAVYFSNPDSQAGPRSEKGNASRAEGHGSEREEKDTDASDSETEHDGDTVFNFSCGGSSTNT